MPRILWVLLLLSMFACDDGEGDPPADDPDVPLRRVDAAQPDAHVAAPDASSREDAAVIEDATPQPEDSGLRPIDGCADVCDLYEECGALEARWPEGRDACLSACEGAMEAQAWPTFVGCLQLRGCARLDECAMPAKPLADCDVLCPVVEACADGAALPLIEDCAATCAAPAMNYPFRVCAAPLLEDDRCDLQAFSECLLADQAPVCHTGCVQRAACDDSVDVVACGLDCLDGLSNQDPLSARRARITRDCFAEREACEEQVVCDARTGCGFDADAFCAEDTCGFFGEGCGAGPLCLQPPETTACLTALMSDGCEAPWSCLNPPVVPDNFCEELCLYEVLCEEIAEGVSEFDCVEACQGALAGGPEKSAYEGFFSCLSVDTCEEFSACFHGQTPAARCDRFCEARAGCDLDEAAACAARCVARFETERSRLELGCGEWMGTCEGLTACALPPAPPCELICDGLDCVAEGDCLRRCDDAELARPESFDEALACVYSLNRCEHQAACLDGEVAAGAACLSYCALQEKCGVGDETRHECLARCGGGGADAEALRLEGALPCVEALNGEASCEDFSACFEALEPGWFCEAFCAERDRCGFAIEGCDVACAERLEDEGFIGEVSCTTAALRRGEGCRAVAECAGIELPPPDEGCQRLCEAEARCDLEIDAFFCELACQPSEDNLIRGACAAYASCDRLDGCLEGAIQENTSCAEICDGFSAIGADFMPREVRGAVACGLYADRADCVERCQALDLLYGDDTPENLKTCVTYSDCNVNAYGLCFDWMSSHCQAHISQEACLAGEMEAHVQGCEAFFAPSQI
ncbi:hypothetical protein KKB55_08620, partial [Myxococcota bacterium]|nr:hypothetical protein [Myxococcota bacterium]